MTSSFRPQVHAAVLTVDLHLPDVHSLKEKRAVIRPILDGARHRFSVAVAEVGVADRWQRTVLSFATVSGSPRQVDEVLDAVERFVWSFPEAEVTGSDRSWVESEAP